MKFVKLSQSEFEEIRKLYEGVMSQACHGLFFREGMILGEEISKIAMQEPDEYYDISANLLSSIESCAQSDVPTCNRLRGIIKRLYEVKTHKRLHCDEIECVSKGDKHCVFRIQQVGGD
jgi:predicted hydrocarbon binding protein